MRSQLTMSSEMLGEPQRSRVYIPIWLPPLGESWASTFIRHLATFSVIKKHHCQFCAMSTIKYIVSVPSSASYVIFSRYQLVLTNSANSYDGCVHLAFLTFQWNSVNLNRMSFLLPNSNFSTLLQLACHDRLCAEVSGNIPTTDMLTTCNLVETTCTKEAHRVKSTVLVVLDN